MRFPETARIANSELFDVRWREGNRPASSMRSDRSPIDYARLFQIHARMRIALRAIYICQFDGRSDPESNNGSYLRNT